MQVKTIRGTGKFVALAAMVVAASMPTGKGASAGQVVDRVVARVEGDILLLSDLRELGQLQQLSGAKPEPESKRLEELIGQWIIEREAKSARFDEPTDAEVDAALAQMEKSLGGESAFDVRLKEVGLSTSALRKLLRREIFFSRYLDYKFRPAVQVDEAAEQHYFDTEFVPALIARGEKAPSLNSVREQIHELLMQRDISARADQWLADSRAQLKVEIVPSPAAGTSGRPGNDLELHE
jgi:hypothetical protein